MRLDLGASFAVHSTCSLLSFRFFDVNTNLMPTPITFIPSLPPQPPPPPPHQNKPCRTNKNCLQDRALYLIITDPQPSILQVWIHHYPQHIYCSTYLHFSLHKYKEVIMLYNSKMMEIDPIDKFIKIPLYIYCFHYVLLPNICSQHYHYNL